MKLLFLLLFTLAITCLQAQKIEKYFDYRWKETDISSARFYGLIVKTDSGWHRQDYFIHESKLQMDGMYEDRDCEVANGAFHFYYANGNLKSAGVYVHGKRQGVWLSYHPNGMMSDSVTYKDGNPVGLKLGWYSSGYPSDSAQYMPDGSGIEVTWFENGNPASAGLYSAGMKPTGKWKYYHSNGKISAVEIYQEGKLTDKQYFDEDGNPMSDTTNKDREAVFAGGLAAWQKYLSKHLYFPSRFQIVNSDQAVVVIAGVIDENGNVTDVTVDTPFYPEFDQIALDAVSKSPKWIPAMLHNRRVNYTFRQPITFSQE